MRYLHLFNTYDDMISSYMSEEPVSYEQVTAVTVNGVDIYSGDINSDSAIKIEEMNHDYDGTYYIVGNGDIEESDLISLDFLMFPDEHLKFSNGTYTIFGSRLGPKSFATTSNYYVLGEITETSFFVTSENATAPASSITVTLPIYSEPWVGYAVKGSKEDSGGIIPVPIIFSQYEDKVIDEMTTLKNGLLGNVTYNKGHLYADGNTAVVEFYSGASGMTARISACTVDFNYSSASTIVLVNNYDGNGATHTFAARDSSNKLKLFTIKNGTFYVANELTNTNSQEGYYYLMVVVAPEGVACGLYQRGHNYNIQL